jgi:hypothetical protein
MALTAKQAFSLALRLVAQNHDVDALRRPNGVDWQVAVKLPDNNFELYDNNVRVSQAKPAVD